MKTYNIRFLMMSTCINFIDLHRMQMFSSFLMDVLSPHDCRDSILNLICVQVYYLIPRSADNENPVVLISKVKKNLFP